MAKDSDTIMSKTKTKRQKVKRRTSLNLRRTMGGSTRFMYLSVALCGVGLIAIIGALFFVMRPSSLASIPLGSLSHTNQTPDTGELVVRINNARRTTGKKVLTTDSTLQAVAETRLKDMITHQRYEHRDSSGKYFYDLLREQSYATHYSCENLDIETTALPQVFIDRWLDSSTGHRECLLHEDVSRVGVASGIFTTDDQARKNYLVVVIFAKPL